MSTSTRVYLTLSPDDLEVFAQARSLTEVFATAVTPALRAAYPQEDEEGLEFLALQEAAAAAPEGARILVAAADLKTGVEPQVGSTPAAVVVGRVEPGRVVSFHVGDEGFVPSPEEQAELSWYDVTEVDEVRRLVVP